MKLCVVDVIAPHYRENIFTKISKEWDTCWIFGKDSSGIKQLEEDTLPNCTFVENKYLLGRKIYYQKSVIPKLFCKDISVFLINGEPYCISMWGLLILRTFFARKKKIYLWTHGWYGREGFFKRLIKRIWTKLSSGIFVYGEYAKSQAIIQGNSADKLWVIHNSLDYEVHISYRAHLRISDVYLKHFGNSNYVLLFIGRLTKSKRLDMLIEAASNLIMSGLKCNVVFVGDGPEKESLMKMANDLGVPVWFYGACYDDITNAELIFNADICVAPGNVGLTAIHSMTFGTPVITHDDYSNQMPEFEAIKVNKTGAFFHAGSVESLVSTIRSWFTTCPDREVVRHACYEEIDNFWTPDFQMTEFRKHIKLSRL